MRTAGQSGAWSAYVIGSLSSVRSKLHLDDDLADVRQWQMQRLPARYLLGSPPKDAVKGAGLVLQSGLVDRQHSVRKAVPYYVVVHLFLLIHPFNADY